MSTERGKKLTRQFKRVLGDANAESSLNQLCTMLKEADSTAFATHIALLEQLPAFFSDVDSSYLEYDDRIKVAIRNLEISSSELNHVNHDLMELNASFHTMLDALGQGLLFFGKDGICSNLYSKACLDTLETKPAGKHICDVLRLISPQRETFNDLIDMLFMRSMAVGFDELMALAPPTYSHTNGYYINLEFKPMLGADGHLHSVLMIATDITQSRVAQMRLREKEAAALRITRIAKNRNFFTRFVNNFREVFDISRQPQQETKERTEQLVRDIHTLKGSAGSFNLEALVHLLHELESLISTDNIPVYEAMQAGYAEIMEEFERSVELGRDILGRDFDRSARLHMIPAEQLRDFAHRLVSDVKAGMTARKIGENYLQALMATDVWSTLKDFDNYIQELGDRFGKPIAPCIFEGENFPVVSDIYENFLVSLTHVARNIVDHGIERPEMRASLKKPVEAQITVSTTKRRRGATDWMRIEISDDGSGIPVDNLRQKLATRMDMNELNSLPDHEVIQLVFEDEVSTRSDVSVLSGRGVGMSAIRHEVQKLGGEIEIFSETGKGVRLRIDLPMIWSFS